jgi:hypothetical protein
VTAKVFSMTCCCQQVRKNFAVHVSLSVFNFQTALLPEHRKLTRLARTNVFAFQRSVSAAAPVALPSVWAVYRVRIVELSTAFFKKVSLAFVFFSICPFRSAVTRRSCVIYADKWHLKPRICKKRQSDISRLPQKNPEQGTWHMATNTMKPV